MISLQKRRTAIQHLPFPPSTVLILLFCYLLSGCSSIPLSTLTKFSDFGPNNLIQLHPDEIRVRLQLPRQAELDPTRTELQLFLATAERQYDEKFNVQLISQTLDHKDDGWFNQPVPVQNFVFVLNDSSKQKFRELQQLLKTASSPNQIIFSASCVVTNLSPEFNSVRLWVDLQLSEKDGFSPLIDGATIEMDLTGNSTANTE